MTERDEALHFANELRSAALRGVAVPQDWTSTAIGHIERLARAQPVPEGHSLCHVCGGRGHISPKYFNQRSAAPKPGEE